MTDRKETGMDFHAGRVRITVARDEADMGNRAAAEAARAAMDAVASGKKVAFWLMAAPSGFSFYEAFVARTRKDPGLAAAARQARYFQFDDYPIGRGDPRFPVTFRHLLESRFFGPLENAAGPLEGKRLLELKGDEGDEAVLEGYRESLLEVLEDESWYVIEVKGIGMDGHWGFHGRETPLDSPAGFIRVPMSPLNVQLQLLDWPRYFRSAADVPAAAVTANVGLFLKADRILDLVPQRTKEFAVLACYGPDAVSPLVPSSALKTHPAARSFLTELSAEALLEYRRRGAPESPVSEETLERLKGAWRSPGDPERERRNIAEMLETLKAVFGQAG